MWSFSIEQVSSISLHNDPPPPPPQRKWDALLWCTSTVLRRNGTVLHSWKSPSLDTRKQQHTNTQKCPIRQRCRSACSQLFGAELQRTHSPTLFSMSSCFCKDASRWLPALLSIASPSFSGDLKPSAHTNNANRLNLMAVVSPLWQLCCGRLAFIQFTMICVDCGLYVHGCNLCACARAHTCTHTLTHKHTHVKTYLWQHLERQRCWYPVVPDATWPTSPTQQYLPVPTCREVVLVRTREALTSALQFPVQHHLPMPTTPEVVLVRWRQGVKVMQSLVQHLPVPTSWKMVLVMRRQALRCLSSWCNTYLHQHPERWYLWWKDRHCDPRDPGATPTCANILKGCTCDEKTGTEILEFLTQHLPVPTSWEVVLVTRRQALRSWSSWWSCCSLVLAFFTMLLTLDSDFLSVDTSRSFSAPSLIFISLRISFFSTWKTKGLMRCTWSIMHWIYSIKSCHMNERESVSLILGVLSHISIWCIVKVTCALLTCCYCESVFNFSEGSHHHVSFHVHVFIFLLHSWQ